MRLWINCQVQQRLPVKIDRLDVQRPLAIPATDSLSGQWHAADGADRARYGGAAPFRR